MVRPRPQTPQGESVSKHETPMIIVSLVSKPDIKVVHCMWSTPLFKKNVRGQNHPREVDNNYESRNNHSWLTAAMLNTSCELYWLIMEYHAIYISDVPTVMGRYGYNLHIQSKCKRMPPLTPSEKNSLTLTFLWTRNTSIVSQVDRLNLNRFRVLRWNV